MFDYIQKLELGQALGCLQTTALIQSIVTNVYVMQVAKYSIPLGESSNLEANPDQG